MTQIKMPTDSCAVAPPTSHIIEAYREYRGYYCKAIYAFMLYDDDRSSLPFLKSKVWAAGRLAAEREIEIWVGSYIDDGLLDPDWEDYKLIWRDVPDADGY